MSIWLNRTAVVWIALNSCDLADAVHRVRQMKSMETKNGSDRQRCALKYRKWVGMSIFVKSKNQKELHGAPRRCWNWDWIMHRCDYHRNGVQRRESRPSKRCFVFSVLFPFERCYCLRMSSDAPCAEISAPPAVSYLRFSRNYTRALGTRAQ